MEGFTLRRNLDFKDKDAYAYLQSSPYAFSTLGYTTTSYVVGRGSSAYGRNVYGRNSLINFDDFLWNATKSYIFNGTLYHIDEEFKLSRNLKFKKAYIVGTRNQFSI